MPWTGFSRLVSWHMDSTVLILESSRLWLRRDGDGGQGRRARPRRRSRRSYSHHGEHLGEDHAGLGQVLVEDALVKVVGGVFDLRGLEERQRREPKASPSASVSAPPPSSPAQ